MVMHARRTGFNAAWVNPKTRTSKANSSIQRCRRFIARAVRDRGSIVGWPICVKTVSGMRFNEVLTGLPGFDTS